MMESGTKNSSIPVPYYEIENEPPNRVSKGAVTTLPRGSGVG